MRKEKKLAAPLAVGLAVATMFGVSAFADSRPQEGTRDGLRSAGEEVTVSARRADDDDDDRSWRGSPSDRRGDRDGVDRRRSNMPRERQSARSSREPYYANGRVSRTERHRDGYRVYMSGERYPFYVPAPHFHADRFRPGITIRIGGIYNPAGYYDYYDGYDRYDRNDRYDRDGRYDRMRGVVERVDYRKGRMQIRDERSGGRTWVYAHRRDLDDLHRGDYVELLGEWTRGRKFHAHQVRFLDDRNYGYRR